MNTKIEAVTAGRARRHETSPGEVYEVAVTFRMRSPHPDVSGTALICRSLSGEMDAAGTTLDEWLSRNLVDALTQCEPEDQRCVFQETVALAAGAAERRVSADAYDVRKGRPTEREVEKFFVKGGAR